MERFAKRGRNLFVLGRGKIPFDAESLLRLVEGFVETGEFALHALERFLLLQQFVFRHDGSFGWIVPNRGSETIVKHDPDDPEEIPDPKKAGGDYKRSL